MLGKQSGQVDIFNYMIYEKLIPKDHLLIKIDSIIDFTFVYGITEKFYSPLGRKSFDPVLMFKICLLEYIYNLSDIKIVERVQTDIAFRWFLKLSLDDEVPDDTTISFFRCNRLGDKPFEEFFNEIVKKCITANIVKNKRYIIDSTNVEANANYPSERKLLCNAYRRLIKSLSKISPEFATAKLQEFESEINAEYKKTEKVSMKTYCKIARKYADEIYLTYHIELSKNHILYDRFVIFWTVIEQYGEGSSNNDRIISCIDPDSKVAYKYVGVRKKGFKNHIIVDEDSEIILGSTQTPFNIGDEKELTGLIEKIDENFELKPDEISADKVYGSINNRAYLKDNDIVCNIQFYDNSNVNYQKFDIKKFQISEDLKEAKCPNGCVSNYYSKGNGKRKEISLKFNIEDCKRCPLREQCLTDKDLKSKNPRKSILISSRYDAVLRDLKRNETEEFTLVINKRSIVERRFATMVRNHGLRRSRYLRIWGARIHITLANIASNIIRMVKILYDNQPKFAIRKI